MPPQGISDDNIFDTAGSPRFRYWATTAFPLLGYRRVSVTVGPYHVSDIVPLQRR